MAPGIEVTNDHADNTCMASTPTGVPAVLSEQCEHQLRIVRQRFVVWIPCLFLVGLCVSILGTIPSVATSIEKGSPTIGAFVFSFFVAYFGWGAFLWLSPIRPKPRIVPYFARELGPYGGKTSSAFTRGRGLYREIVALDQLAVSLGVEPLSKFGFAYDHFGQEVRWHSPSEGLRTADALRLGLDASLPEAPDVVQDLEALVSVTRAAVDQGVDFSLVLRLLDKDNMQGVCTREDRQGSFW